MATLLTKKSDTASSVPLAGDLTNAAGGAELAVNTADKKLYVKNSSGTVVELTGLKPTDIGVSVQAYDAQLSTLAGASADRATYLASNEGFGFRNRIINGDMRIDQRNAGGSVAVNDAQVYTVDRFRAQDATDGAFTVQQVTDAPDGFVNSAKITVTTADASLGATQFANFTQFIEGYNTSDLGWGTANAKTITLSFWVKSSLTGTFGGALLNSAVNRSYPFSYTISAANTWEQKTVTIAGDTSGTWLTNNATGIAVHWGLGIGSTYSGPANAWAGALYFAPTGATSVVGTSGATFYITGVQLEAGSVATPFERRDYGRELALCQRYYENSFNGTAAVNGTTGSIQAGTWSPYSPDDARSGVIAFKVSKRATPTFVFYNDSSVTPTPGVWSRYNGTWNDVTPSVGNPSIWGFYVQGYRAGGFTAFYTYLGGGFWVASAEL